MNRRIASLSVPILATGLLAGCSGSMFSFGGPSEQVNRGPENATEYRCEGGRRFYVRTLDANAVWLIAPDRELRLAKSASDGRYRAGRVVLELAGQTATLDDPPTQFRDCKVPGPDKK
jgi:membrane-bound inhibitor of C-type lysozyme